MGSHIPDVKIYVDSASPNTDKLFVAMCFKPAITVTSYPALPSKMSQVTERSFYGFWPYLR